MAIDSGGALSAILRVLISKVMPDFIFGNIPFPILVVNVLECFMMGSLSELLYLYVPNMIIRSFIMPGFLGGFTTFSAFTLEIGNLVEKDLYDTTTYYTILSVCCSIVSFFIGMKMVRILQ